MNEIEDTIRLSMQGSSEEQSSKEDMINKGDGRRPTWLKEGRLCLGADSIDEGEATE